MTATHLPLVSVVMVIRDVERYLSEAIESILSQTFREFEFIIVDFGSRDRSKDIAASYAALDSRIKLSEIAPCSYIEAKIAACSLPKGLYIAIQDADDVSLPDRLQSEVDFLEKNPDVGFLGGAVEWIDAHGGSLATADDYPTRDPEIRSELRVRNTFWHPTVLMRREAYVLVGGYRAAFTQSDDYDLWLRMSERYQCANLREKVLKYRVHSQQLSVRKRKDQVFCTLAARAAASLRREGKVDPLDSAKEMTPALLASMGVSEAAQKKEFVDDFRGYIRLMFESGSYDAVPTAVAEMLRDCKGSYHDSLLIVDMQVLAARASWKKGRNVQGLLAIARAVRARPRLFAHPRMLLQELTRCDSYALPLRNWP
jgi:hypothetical protein